MLQYFYKYLQILQKFDQVQVTNNLLQFLLQYLQILQIFVKFAIFYLQWAHIANICKLQILQKIEYKLQIICYNFYFNICKFYKYL